MFVEKSVPPLRRSSILSGAVLVGLWAQCVGCAQRQPEPGVSSDAVAEYRQKLRDPDAAARRSALISLRGMGQRGVDHLPAITEAVKDPDPQVRMDAVHALGEFGVVAKPAIPVLLALLENGSADERRVVLAALKLIGVDNSAESLLLDTLGHSDPRLRAQAAALLGGMGDLRSDALPRLLASLDDASPEVRLHVTVAIGNFRGQAIEAISRLTDMLKSPLRTEREVRVKHAAAQALGRISAQGRQVLIDALTSEDFGLRRLGAWGLGQEPAPCTEAVVALAKVVGDPDFQVRYDAIVTLGRFGAEAESATPVLQHALRDEEPELQLAAAEALWKINGQAEPVIPVLIERLRHPQGRVTAVRLLAGLGRPAVDRVTNYLTDEDHNVRAGVAEALGKIGVDAASSVVELRKALEDSEIHVRIQVALALWEITRDQHGALPVLIAALQHEGGDGQAKQAAARALAEMGPAAKDAATALREAMSGDYLVRQSAIAALKKIVGEETKQEMKP